MGPHNADVKTEIWKCPHKHNGYLSPQGRIEIFKDVMCPDKRSRGVLWNAHILIFPTWQGMGVPRMQAYIHGPRKWALLCMYVHSFVWLCIAV